MICEFVWLVHGGKGSSGVSTRFLLGETPRQVGHVRLCQHLVDPAVTKDELNIDEVRGAHSLDSFFFYHIFTRWYAACFDSCLLEPTSMKSLVMAAVHCAN